MSTKSKTSDKLVASVRKSKTGTVAQKTSERQKAAEPAAKPKAPTARSASTSASKATAGSNNGYSFGRRVWPD